MSSENIQQFMALANVSSSVAEGYLNQQNDNLGAALNAFYAASAGASSEAERSTSPVSSTSRSGTPGNTGSKFMSFSEMTKGQNNDDEDDNRRNTFAGGETSGLEITDPNDPNDPNDSNSLIRDLLEKAKRGAQQMGNDESSNEDIKADHFTGKGYRLGSVIDAQSQIIEDKTRSGKESSPKRVTREITFWKEGFQVGEGKLFRYDDPANSFFLNELNQGRAPLKLLDVEFGKEVDVNVFKKLDESYKAPKRPLGGFQGSGQRLGSPIPGDVDTYPEPVNVPPTSEEKAKVDEQKGDSSVQIRYTTGKREIFCCNATDSVQSLYDHVKSNTQDTRKFTLNYSFPVKPIEDYDATIKDANLINSVVVQRWV